MKTFLRRLTCVALICLAGAWLSTETAAQDTNDGCTPWRGVEVSADASPDLDSSRTGIQVRIGTRVLLSGTSRLVAVAANCTQSEGLATLSWSLFFQPSGGEETEITSRLGATTTQTSATPSTTSFTATAEGIYRARVRGTAFGLPAVTKETLINVPPPPAALIQSCGKVSFLRAHDLGGRFGPPNDFIDVEVVTKLNTLPARAMGFQLRNDGNEPARRGMLDLLRDGFNNNTNVCLDYLLVPGRNNGVIIRVALNK